MSWLDKLLGREKKTGETGGEGAPSMPSEGMREAPEPGSMRPEGTGAGDQPTQEEQDRPPAAP
jgi:hypothetical protein